MSPRSASHASQTDESLTPRSQSPDSATICSSVRWVVPDDLKSEISSDDSETSETLGLTCRLNACESLIMRDLSPWVDDPMIGQIHLPQIFDDSDLSSVHDQKLDPSLILCRTSRCHQGLIGNSKMHSAKSLWLLRVESLRCVESRVAICSLHYKSDKTSSLLTRSPPVWLTDVWKTDFVFSHQSDSLPFWQTSTQLPCDSNCASNVLRADQNTMHVLSSDSAQNESEHPNIQHVESHGIASSMCNDSNSELDLSGNCYRCSILELSLEPPRIKNTNFLPCDSASNVQVDPNTQYMLSSDDTWNVEEKPNTKHAQLCNGASDVHVKKLCVLGDQCRGSIAALNLEAPRIKNMNLFCPFGPGSEILSYFMLLAKASVSNLQALDLICKLSQIENAHRQVHLYGIRPFGKPYGSFRPEKANSVITPCYPYGWWTDADGLEDGECCVQ